MTPTQQAYRDQEILAAAARAQSWCGVAHPRTVQSRLDWYRPERALRTDMERLAREGKLIHLGPCKGWLVAGSRAAQRLERLH